MALLNKSLAFIVVIRSGTQVNLEHTDLCLTKVANGGWIEVRHVSGLPEESKYGRNGERVHWFKADDNLKGTYEAYGDPKDPSK